MRDDGGILARAPFSSGGYWAFWLGLGGKKSKEKERGEAGRRVYICRVSASVGREVVGWSG